MPCSRGPFSSRVSGFDGMLKNAAINHDSGKMNPRQNSMICRPMYPNGFVLGSSKEGGRNALTCWFALRSGWRCGEKTPLLPHTDDAHCGRRTRSVQEVSVAIVSRDSSGCMASLPLFRGLFLGRYISAGNRSLNGDVVRALVDVSSRDVDGPGDEYGESIAA